VPAIEAIDLRRSFRTPEGDLEILKGVNLMLARAEIVAIVGASGVGKSTLLHCLAGLDRPTGGQVLVDGEDLLALDEAATSRLRNSRIGFVFQFHNLLRDFTALENVMMPLLLGGASRADAGARARRLLDEVGLGRRASHRPGELSGGEAQRVAVARALATDPVVVLADEPSGNLDPGHSEELHSLLWRLRDQLGRSFLIATHDRELAARADRVIEVRDGLAWPLLLLDQVRRQR
jgi:lipoprotein-releasing system ATP-binding protein